VRRTAFALALVFLAMPASNFRAQDTATAGTTIPVATRSQADCTGFIADPVVPHDIFVAGGGDDDFHSRVRQFVDGESIYIGTMGNGGNVSVGSEYIVVRPADDLFRTMHYSGERSALSALGKPYEDVARVRVTHVNSQGPVAKIIFSCQGVQTGDTLIPFQPRAIPDYTVSAPLDHFAPIDTNKPHGKIAATLNNFGFFGNQNVVYLSLGEKDGAHPGERFRIYKVIAEHSMPETIGEAVVMSVQAKSCVAMVVASYREISSGDSVEAE
jgi:hypothetical protein